LAGFVYIFTAVDVCILSLCPCSISRECFFEITSSLLHFSASGLASVRTTLPIIDYDIFVENLLFSCYWGNSKSYFQQPL